ncbi:RDD family protein [Actinophytocola sp.]|uniref:RDD family protein n=1 Tax=Actinophytocola sp. TaxID=1872138 RepID=UPI002D7F1B8C|nr:RDD family protein [Actinophytocola sp.]HET9138315.1 RDD family protein [Actinophytocola sp.]
MTTTATAAVATRQKQRTFELTAVRSRDLRRLREYGPPPGAVLPEKHGGKDDPRYPSPTTLRWGLAVAIDLLLHLHFAVVAVVAVSRVPDVSLGLLLLAGPATFIAVSILHRVFVQRMLHATLGKAVTGIRYVRDDTGGRPTLGSLARTWFTGALAAVLNVLSGF